MTSLPCPIELWPLFTRLLDEGMALPATRRDAWLDALRQTYPTLHACVAAALTASDNAGDWLETISLPSTAEPAMYRAGQRIGPWRLLSALGRGGMCEVWSAERADSRYERRVALKLPHADSRLPTLRRRFDRERDILARLEHPNIAHFYDAGVEADGQPWLALEAVEGEPIGRYCQRRRLDLDARLALLAQIAQAVQYAHSRLIVHRDLKPSNVLVDCHGTVKLLDFGIAKLLDATRDSHTAALDATLPGDRAATPGYAAPEQLAGEAPSAATDVYSLGVLAFELLTGVLPFARSRRFAPPGRDVEAPLASTRIASDFASALHTDSRTLARRLRGDLDAILAKALDADSTRRYPSMQAFADDIACFRQCRPVQARRITLRHRATKFLRRHWLAVAATTTFATFAATAIGHALWQSERVARESRRALAARDFLFDAMFNPNDPRIPNVKPRGEMSSREMLDLGVDRLDDYFANDPATHADALGKAARIYVYLGDAVRALTLRERRRELLVGTLGERHPQTLAEDLAIVWALLVQHRFADVDAALRRLDIRLSEAGFDAHLLRAEWWLARSDLLAHDGTLEQREAALLRARSLYVRYAADDSGHIAALSNLGAIELDRARAATALEYFDEALRRYPVASPQIAPDLARLHARRARALAALGRTHEAREALVLAQRQFRQTVGMDSPLADEARAMTQALNTDPQP